MGIVQTLQRKFSSTADASGWTELEDYNDNFEVTATAGVPAEKVKHAGAPGEVDPNG